MAATTPGTATYDAIMDAAGSPRCFAKADPGAMFDVITKGIVKDGQRVAYGRAVGTGFFVRIVKTGQKVRRDGQVRVRIEVARDTGDRAGTLAFGDAETFGGVAPEAAFNVL